MDKNHLIITANRRLARTEAEGRTLFIDDYLMDGWNSYQTGLTLLNEHQAWAQWEKIIRSDGDGWTDVRLLAQKAREAFGYVYDYQIPFAQLKNVEMAETQKFCVWMDEYEKSCAARHWLDPKKLLNVLTKEIALQPVGTTCRSPTAQINLPKQITLVGFLERSPALQNWINALKEKGCNVIVSQPPPTKPPVIKRCLFQNAEQEREAMVHWAQTQQMNGVKSILCVIPDLQKDRKKLVRLMPESNISGGHWLSEEPLIATAIKWLRLKTEALPLGDILYLLRSPCLGNAKEEFSDRSLLASQLLEAGRREYELKDFLAALQKNHFACPSLLEMLLHLQTSTFRNTQKPSQWAEQFTYEFHPYHDEKETMIGRQYELLLKSLSSLDIIEPIMDRLTAIETLEKMASQILFQAPSTQSSIQVLGLLEAIGQPCDAIWIASLNDQDFPLVSNPNQLIPLTIKRKYHLPNSSTEKEFEFGHLWLNQRLSLTQNEVILSSYEQQEDEHFQPSPLIQNYPLEDRKNFLPPEKKSDSLSIEIIIDDEGQSLSLNNGETISGGTDIFKQQAICPFRAYAKHRLKAQPIQPLPVTGFSPMEHGILVHSALKHFWKFMHTQEQLIRTSNDQLEEILSRVVTLSWKENIPERHIPHAFIEIEKNYIQDLFRSWIEWEKRRRPFTVIAIEKWNKATIGPLTIKIQIDRVDQIQDNSILLIDYKTGKTSLDTWLGDRPEEPQLLLYAVSYPGKVEAIAFAQIRPDDFALKGMGAREDILSSETKIKELKMLALNQWDQQLNDWKKNLEKLANDFARGYAKVDPKNGSTDCAPCPFKSLCRIDETN